MCQKMKTTEFADQEPPDQDLHCLSSLKYIIGATLYRMTFITTAKFFYPVALRTAKTP